MYTQSNIIDALRKVNVPNEQTDVVSKGLVKKVSVNGLDVEIILKLEQEKAPFKDGIIAACKDAVKRFVSADLSTKVGFEMIEPVVDTSSNIGVHKVKNILAVASGKGGVGKSTVTANLSISLAKLGYKVGLIDADIFGPSVPKMFGLENEQPLARKENGKDVIIPALKYGVKILSIGFFVNPKESLAWRGPVAGNALKQLINDTEWGELDYLLFDMPPGTSDIHLTLVQTVSLAGAVIVSTPQDIALVDAVKGIDLFQKDQINVPIVGLVENMAWFTPAELPENKYYIFGKGGGKKLCEEMNIPFLGHIPIVQGIREGGDEGEPVATKENTILSNMFDELARNVAKRVEERNTALPPTQKVTLSNQEPK